MTWTASHSGYGHQQHWFNEGVRVVRHNVPLGSCQSNMEPGRASAVQPYIHSAHLLSSQAHAGALPQNSMMGRSDSSSICVHAAVKRNDILECLKKNNSLRWLWKFKYTWFNSCLPTEVFFFFITLIKCVWASGFSFPLMHTSLCTDIFCQDVFFFPFQ